MASRPVALLRGDSKYRDYPNSWIRALASASGATLQNRDNALGITGRNAPYVIIAAFKPWRSEALRRAMELGIPVLTTEHGYFGDRTKNPSLAWNGVNGRGVRPPYGGMSKEMPPSIWNFNKKPPDNPGRVLICKQLLNDQSMEGLHPEAWTLNAYHTLRARWPRAEIDVREHPLTLPENRRGPTLEEILHNYDLVASYSSNSAIDAILRGIPTLLDSAHSVAYSVATVRGLNGVWDHPEREEITAWGKWLAWQQWSVKELENGAALEHLLKVIPERGADYARTFEPTAK